MGEEKLLSDKNIDEEYALVLLVKEIMSNIDEVASLKARGHKADLSLSMLKEMCGVLRDFSPEQKDRYFNLLLKLTGKEAEPSRAVYTEDYAKAVKGSKERFIEKIKEDLKIKAA